jgi:uncharacterized membrane-anchored protein
MATSRTNSTPAADLLSKVPEVTLAFWVIKVLCTTVGETFADWLNGRLGDNLGRTTLAVGALLVIALIAQFRVHRYVPPVYWVVVVLLSVFGTLITDNLTDGHDVPLTNSTILFGGAMLVAFGAWWLSERTLSIHSIYTGRREAFYWTAILFTFALGTAAGDLIGEQYNLGYGISVLLYAGLIGVVAIAYWRFHLNAIAAFWFAYILTRPLGASIGDLLSQPRTPTADDPSAQPGLGLGTTLTSFVFLAAILCVVVGMVRSARSQSAPAERSV